MLDISLKSLTIINVNSFSWIHSIELNERLSVD